MAIDVVLKKRKVKEGIELEGRKGMGHGKVGKKKREPGTRGDDPTCW